MIFGGLKISRPILRCSPGSDTKQITIRKASMFQKHHRDPYCIARSAMKVIRDHQKHETKHEATASRWCLDSMADPWTALSWRSRRGPTATSNSSLRIEALLVKLAQSLGRHTANDFLLPWLSSGGTKVSYGNLHGQWQPLYLWATSLLDNAKTRIIHQLERFTGFDVVPGVMNV